MTETDNLRTVTPMPNKLQLDGPLPTGQSPVAIGWLRLAIGWNFIVFICVCLELCIGIWTVISAIRSLHYVIGWLQ